MNIEANFLTFGTCRVQSPTPSPEIAISATLSNAPTTYQYDGMLGQPGFNKDADVLQGLYANLACTTGNWDIANQQFKLLGEDVYPSAFGGVAKYKQKRTQAEK